MTRPSVLLTSLAVLALTGCGDADTHMLSGEPPPMVETSGARLSARFVDAEGGARRFLHFVDRETGEPCRFSNQTEEDGTVYCIPAASGVILHRNAACDDAVIATSWAEHEWAYAPAYSDTTSVVRLGAPVTFRGPYYFDSGRGCVEWTTDTTGLVYEVVERRALETFPPGKLVTNDADDRLATVSFQGEDGSYSIEVLMDTLADVVCRPGATEAGTRCVPEMQDVDALEDELFDPTCERPLVAAYSAGRVGRIIGRGDEIYRFEATDWGAPVARIVDGRCVVDDRFSQGRRTLYFVTPYPASDWPEVTLTPFGGPQVVAKIAATPAGAPIDARTSLAPDELFDLLDEDTACGPAWMDGSLRCAPEISASEVRWREVYADARCSTKAVALTAGADVPRHIRTNEGRASAANASLPIVRVFNVGTRARTPYWMTRGCTPMTDDSLDVYLLGEEVAADQLPTLDLRLVER